MKIIECGHPIDGIPYPVEIWNADYHMRNLRMEPLKLQRISCLIRSMHPT